MQNRFAGVIAVGLIAAAGQAQVVINEVFPNPPGSSDPRREFIELYGAPGLKLDGYALAYVIGGQDIDSDNVLDVPPEIDESWDLSGLTIGSNGFLVLYNDTDAAINPSQIPGLVSAGTTLVPFTAAFIASVDTPGNLENDGSGTFVLLRRRPTDAGFPFGQYWRKDVNQDENEDSRLDFGPPFQSFGVNIEPYQMIDDLAWSNAGGKEYTRSSEQEISETSGFNPDGASRVAYYNANPNLGLRLDSNSNIVPTRMADEEFIYGDALTADPFAYDAVRSGAPTDPNGDGFQDIATTGARLTPGNFNDTGNFTQFRFVVGDFDFDGDVDATDQSLIQIRLGASLDDNIPAYLYDNETPGDPNDDFQTTYWSFQGRDAVRLLAMMQMDPTDGAMGMNETFVTQDDLDAFAAIYNPPCLGDWDGSGGQPNSSDFLAFLNDYSSQNPAADLAPPGGNGVFDSSDFLAFLNLYSQGC
ncbi:MAG: GC-type dockerin domain-anchored protein [Phycisphaerales bacterium]|jgi:hypothetical protein|nr:GC-type dockerin domain-anchored protein [Phycisphaerales bacterium]